MKSDLKSKLYGNRHIIFLFLFLFVHTVSCFFTNCFGDDYYYAAFLKNGPEYFFNENIFHYMHTNGRALVHLLDELLLGIDFNLWRLSSVFVMGALAVIASKLASRQYLPEKSKESYKNALIVTLSIISVTDIAILRQSVYWATGALNYLFPATLTLLYIYLAFRARNDISNGHGFYPLIILALIGSATTEQASAALLLATLWLLVTSIIEKKRTLIFPIITNVIASAVGLSTILLSPGSAERTTYYPEFYSMSLLGRILHNRDALIKTVFGHDGMYALIAASMVIVIFYSFKKLPLLSVGSAISLGVYIYGVNVKPEIFGSLFFLGIISVPIIAVMVYTVWDYFKNQEADNLYFVFTCVAMQCVMALSPEFGPRTLTVSLFLLIVPVVRFIIENGSDYLYAVLGALAIVMLPSDLSSFKALVAFLIVGVLASYLLFKKCSFPIIPTLVAISMLAIFATVPIGYGQNLKVMEVNRKQIENYEPSEGALTLYYLPNSTYKYTMPYDDPYHQHVLMRLCGLPESTEVIYLWYEE